MQISINPILESKYYTNPYKNEPKQESNLAFRSNKLAANFIKSDIYRGLSGIDFNKTNLITIDEVRDLLLKCKNNQIDLKDLISEYGQEIGEKLFKALNYKNNQYFLGDNPNAEEENYLDYFNQFKILTGYEKLSLMTQYANLNDGKYLDFWRNNPEKLSMSVNMNTYLPSQLKNFNSETWNAILNSYIKIFNHKDKAEIMDAMLKYSFDGYSRKINFLPQINDLIDSLIVKLENKQITFSVFQKEMKNLYNLIESSKISFCDDYDKDLRFRNHIKAYSQNDYFAYSSPKSLANNLRNCQNFINDTCNYEKIRDLINNLKKVSLSSTEKDFKIPLWRSDRIKFFNSLNSDRNNITSLMEKAQFGDVESKNKVLEYFNVQKPEIKRNAFLSTAIKPYEFSKTAVKWNLTLEKGVNYLYFSQVIDQLKCSSHTTEAELLVHPCILKIKSAKYDTDNILILDADILPPKENLSKESLI